VHLYVTLLFLSTIFDNIIILIIINIDDGNDYDGNDGNDDDDEIVMMI